MNCPTSRTRSALNASFERGEYPDGLSADNLLTPIGAPAPPTIEERQRQIDLQFYQGLGAEDASCKCQRQDCSRGAIKLSVYCRRHYFEKIWCRECPFDR